MVCSVFVDLRNSTSHCGGWEKARFAANRPWGFLPKRIFSFGEFFHQRFLWEFFSKVLSLVRAFYPPFLSCFFLYFLSVGVTYLAQQISQQGVVPSLPCTSIITFCSGQLLQAAPPKKSACPPSAYLYNHKQRYCGTVTPTTHPPR